MKRRTRQRICLVLVSLFFLSLAACGPKAGIDVRIVEKPIPILTPCISKEDVAKHKARRPAPLASRLMPADPGQKLGLLAAQVKRLTGYADESDALLSACKAD